MRPRRVVLLGALRQRDDVHLPVPPVVVCADGRFLGLPFKSGVEGHGGMPADFDNASHGLERLAVTQRHGVVFASVDVTLPPLAEYLGPTNLGWFDRVFDGREFALCRPRTSRADAVRDGYGEVA